MKERLPEWALEWLDLAVPTMQVLLILAAALLVVRLIGGMIDRLCERRELPLVLALATRRIVGFMVGAAALFMILDVFGVSGTVLWTAFTSFAAVGAVAFFAAWSVLSNVFCTVLIFITRPFHLNDVVELLENGEKPGLKGRVIDVNLIYTTLMETGDHHNGTIVQIPNGMFFQRILRRWRGSAIPALPATLKPKEPDTPAPPPTDPPPG